VIARRETGIHRRQSRAVRIRGLVVGGGAPISVQSMTNTDTRDVEGTVAQIRSLAANGCELVRLAVPDAEAAAALRLIREQVDIPLAADIHFDYRLALAALEAGVDKLRLNPGNIGGPDRVRANVAAAGERGVPIMIVVNAGSLPKEVLARHGGPTAEAMVQAAQAQIAQGGQQRDDGIRLEERLAPCQGDRVMAHPIQTRHRFAHVT